MNREIRIALSACSALLLWASASDCAAQAAPTPPAISPATMPRIGTVDERFQSYNIEMVEVTGGRFWKPYNSPDDISAATPNSAQSGSQQGSQPGGMPTSLFEYRPPIDLSNARLRKLAAALGPAYLRVSGTWANSTFFQDSDDSAPATPPTGFNSVLTRKEWKGVVDFSHAANAQIVTSFAISAGTRDASGVWTPVQAKQFLAYTQSAGGSIAAAEFMNEPTFAEIGGAPHGYDAKAYARDFAVFRAFAKSQAPGMLILGPGGVGEGTALAPVAMHLVASDAIFEATGPAFDAVSYHSYGTVSSRCAPPGSPMGSPMGTTAAAALSEEWLGRGERGEAFYAALRDRFEPGKPIWNTETAQAACGGDRWASAFVDTFRYLNQLGSLARHGVQVQLHNTLAASDYGLLDEKTYEPRPNYWAALLWRRLMGTTVLDPGPSPEPALHLYAHCLRDKPGGVALLAINADRDASHSLEIPKGAEGYTLTARDLLGTHVELNGKELSLGANDDLPALTGAPEPKGQITFAPASITFLAFPRAHNASCQ
jgi:heparanase 1